MVFLKEFFKIVDFEQTQQTTKKHAKFPMGGREFMRDYNSDSYDFIVEVPFNLDHLE